MTWRETHSFLGSVPSGAPASDRHFRGKGNWFSTSRNLSQEIGCPALGISARRQPMTRLLRPRRWRVIRSAGCVTRNSPGRQAI